LNSTFKHTKHNLPSSSDEMLETVTPIWRANILDLEAHKPHLLKRREGVIIPGVSFL
jgi:hypothetical protein